MQKEAATQAREKPQATHEIPTDLNREGVAEITTALRQLKNSDTFALYLKTKNFPLAHDGAALLRLSPAARRTCGTDFLAMTDDIAERARKIGGTTLRSISDSDIFTASTPGGQQR